MSIPLFGGNADIINSINDDKALKLDKDKKSSLVKDPQSKKIDAQEKAHQSKNKRKAAEKEENEKKQKLSEEQAKAVEAKAKQEAANANYESKKAATAAANEKLANTQNRLSEKETELYRTRAALDEAEKNEIDAKKEWERAQKQGTPEEIEKAKKQYDKAKQQSEILNDKVEDIEGDIDTLEREEIYDSAAVKRAEKEEAEAAKEAGVAEEETKKAEEETENAEKEVEEAAAKTEEAEQAEEEANKEVEKTTDSTIKDTTNQVAETPNKVQLTGKEIDLLTHPFFNGITFEDAIPLYGSTFMSNTETDTEKRKTLDKENSASTGLPGILNPYAVLTLKTSKTDASSKMLYRDGMGGSGDVRWYDIDTSVTSERKDPSVQSLIKTFGKFGEITPANKQGAMPYNYSDFAYCKWFGKISNNHLITLRRFAHPVNASLEFSDWDTQAKKAEEEAAAAENAANAASNAQSTSSVSQTSQANAASTEPIKEDANSGNNTKKQPEKEEKKADFYHMPVAQAVTWFGQETGNELSSFMNFDAGLKWKDINSNVNIVEEDQSDNTSMSNPASFQQGMFRFISVITGEGDLSKDHLDGMARKDPYQNGPYSNRVEGPVNCIDSTKARERGFKFEQTFNIKFHYSARSISNINTKAAMLDIIGNMLVLTYGVGAFWGGMNKCVGSIKAYPWKEGMQAWFRGDPLGFMKAMKNAVTKATTNIKSVLDELSKDPGKVLKQIAGVGAKMAFGAMVRALGDNPQYTVQYKSLLTGEPVGEWHLVIGNPYNPIMTIGNLICEGCKFEFGKELGPDDFPTELTCTVTLKHGMPLDRIGIESMFNRGWGRVYTVPTAVDSTSSSRNSKIDSSWHTSGGSSKANDWGAYWDELVAAKGDLHNARAHAIKTLRSGGLAAKWFGDVAWKYDAKIEKDVNIPTLSGKK